MDQAIISLIPPFSSNNPNSLIPVYLNAAWESQKGGGGASVNTKNIFNQGHQSGFIEGRKEGEITAYFHKSIRPAVMVIKKKNLNLGGTQEEIYNIRLYRTSTLFEVDNPMNFKLKKHSKLNSILGGIGFSEKSIIDSNDPTIRWVIKRNPQITDIPVDLLYDLGKQIKIYF